VSAITFQFVPSEQMGYGRAGVYMARELMKRGITVFDDDGDPHTTAQKRTRSPEPTNLTCWVSVPIHAKGWFSGQHVSILTMWETDTLPGGFREVMHEFDTVMVPSYQNLELFSEYHDNVKLVLLGVDPTLWNYTPPRESKTFDFLISGHGQRKGVDVAYEAFQRVFGQWWTYDDDDRPVYKGPLDRPPARLVMKSKKGHNEYFAPGVRQVAGTLTDRDEVELYRNSHCYLQPARGEGFGLQPLQAIASGRPTILTNAHGHESYAHLGIPISTTMSKAGYFLMGEAGQWWEPDLDEVCEAMWDVYCNYDTHAATAKESAAVVASDWTWSNTADQFLDAVGDQIDLPYRGDSTWVKPERRLYKIITTRDHTSDGAGITRHFLKGKEYWDIADIKRIMFEADLLDPSCLDGDHGLAPDQVDRFDGYRASREWCPTCQQRLNSGEQYSDWFLSQPHE
jgi:glycosyltransferase involved in cell wall biosynthesis